MTEVDTDVIKTTGNSAVGGDSQELQKQQFADWFIFRETRHFGPLTTEQINKMLLEKQIALYHHIWRPGFKSWKLIKEEEVFQGIGSNDIEEMSDNDFSYKARLKGIDKIKAPRGIKAFLGKWKLK